MAFKVRVSGKRGIRTRVYKRGAKSTYRYLHENGFEYDRHIRAWTLGGAGPSLPTGVEQLEPEIVPGLVMADEVSVYGVIKGVGPNRDKYDVIDFTFFTSNANAENVKAWLESNFIYPTLKGNNDSGKPIVDDRVTIAGQKRQIQVGDPKYYPEITVALNEAVSKVKYKVDRHGHQLRGAKAVVRAAKETQNQYKLKTESVG